MTTPACHDEILNEEWPLPRQVSVPNFFNLSSDIIALRSVLLNIAVNDPDNPPTVQEEVLLPVIVIYLSLLIFCRCFINMYFFVSWTKKIVPKHSPSFNVTLMNGLFGPTRQFRNHLRHNFDRLRFLINVIVSVMVQCLTLSDPMSDLVRHYDFPVPGAFLDL
jgi:hypothetical protein